MKKQIYVKRYLGKRITVKQLEEIESNLPYEEKFSFVSNSQDVDCIREYIGGRISNQFDTFFIQIIDGDYTIIYGMENTVPYIYKYLYPIHIRICYKNNRESNYNNL